MSWTWSRARVEDINPIVCMAQDHFESEADTIFRTDPLEYGRNVAIAVATQSWNPYTELLMVAKQGDQIIAYMWAKRGDHAVWARDEIIAIRMAHLDLTLPARDRIQLVKEMIGLWEVWAIECGVPVVCSTTMRGDQGGFLKIHSKLGYDVRGSFAYKRLA